MRPGQIQIPLQQDAEFRQLARDTIAACSLYHYPFCAKYVPQQEKWLAQNDVYAPSLDNDGLNELFQFCIDHDTEVEICRHWDAHFVRWARAKSPMARIAKGTLATIAGLNPTGTALACRGVNVFSVPLTPAMLNQVHDDGFCVDLRRGFLFYVVDTTYGAACLNQVLFGNQHYPAVDCLWVRVAELTFRSGINQYDRVPAADLLAYERSWNHMYALTIDACAVHHYPFCAKFPPQTSSVRADDQSKQEIDFCCDHPDLELCQQWSAHHEIWSKGGTAWDQRKCAAPMSNAQQPER